MARARFGLFDFNPATGELFREGRIVHLQAQPATVLALLVSANGELVTRELLRQTLWADGTNVDFDRSLNFAVAQLRTALGDSADSPTFIRTVPKRGYQFLAPVSHPAAPPPAEPRKRKWLPSALAAAAFAIVALALIAAFWKPHALAPPRIAIARFHNETGNPALDRFADALTDSIVAGMTDQTAGRYGVIGNAPILRRARVFQDLDEIGSSLKARYAIVGQVQRDGPGVRILAHLIRLPEKTHLFVSRVPVENPASESELAARIVAELTKRLASPPPVTN